MVSSCPCCSRERDSFVCRSCLTKLLKLYKTQASSHHSLLPSAQARAANGIRIADKTRQLEAKHWDVETRTNNLQHKISTLKQGNEAALQASRQRRHSIQERRTRLSHVRARLQPSSSLPSAGLTLNPAYTTTTGSHDVEEHLEEIASQLASTRQILVQELLDALDVVESSMLGCRYQIASLPVPSLPELHVLPKHQLNATLAMLVLLVKHISIYLGIQLPFVLLGTATKPLIRALSGTMNALRYPKAYPLYMSSGPTYTSATSSTSATTSAQALVSSATATPASHAQALVIGVRMLGFDANYLHNIASSDRANATQIIQADTVEEASRVDHFDILSLLVDIGLARTTGWRAHVLSRKTDTLRKVETEADFAQFIRALEDKPRTAPVLIGGTQDISRKKGKYVVVTSTLPAAKDLDTSDAGDAADNPDEGWDMV